MAWRPPKPIPEFYDGHKTLNPANEGTYEFIGNVLSEVMELFPSGYVHFGGDEVREHRWGELPEMEDFMQRHGYSEWHEVEEHFDRFVAEYIVEQGYTPIGWDEIAAFDVHPDTIVQWWLHLRPQARDRAIEKRPPDYNLAHELPLFRLSEWRRRTGSAMGGQRQWPQFSRADPSVGARTRLVFRARRVTGTWIAGESMDGVHPDK